MVLEWMLYGATRYHGKTAAQPLPDGSDDSELSPEEDEPVIRTHRYTEEAVRPQYTIRYVYTDTRKRRQTDRHMDKYIHTHT